MIEFIYHLKKHILQSNIASHRDADDVCRRLRTYDCIYYKEGTRFRHRDVNKRLCYIVSTRLRVRLRLRVRGRLRLRGRFRGRGRVLPRLLWYQSMSVSRGINPRPASVELK